MIKFWPLLEYGGKMQGIGGMIMLAMLLLNLLHDYGGEALQILSKSKLEKCEKTSTDGGSNNNANLNCTHKIIINMAIPSNSVSCVFSSCCLCHCIDHFYEKLI